MTNRERFRRALAHQTADRIPHVEICFWPETVTRWRREGLPENVEPSQHFGLDRLATFSFDCSLGLESRTIEENDQWLIQTNGDGVAIKSWKQNYATPVEVDFAIKQRADWDRLKARLQPNASRFAPDQLEINRRQVNDDTFIAITPTEPCWYALRTIGHEALLEAMALEPEYVEDLVAAHTDLSLRMLEMALARGLRFDAVWFFADLCYKNGMLFSPATYRRLIQPYHRRFREFCSKHDLFLILHCDGDLRQFIPLLVETGFDCIQPLEARAGNDVRKLKPQYGKQIAFFGNINMDVLARGDRQEIRDEVVSKVTAAKAGGGYIYHSDHSVPPTVSFDSYRYALELAREHGTF